jgi:hypothetical protein
MQGDDETWALIRLAYADALRPLAAIAAEHGVTRQSIAARARREKWPPRGSPAIRRPEKKPAGKARLPTRKARTAMVARLYRAISLKLEQMETRMASGEARSAQDEERESRALATMITNFEKVTEAAAELDRNRDAAGRAEGARGADAERMRREIAERLERLGVGGALGGGSRPPQR